MMKINLLDNLIPDPLVKKPAWEKFLARWKEMEDKKPNSSKRKITMCGCDKHPVNPKKDVYKQHNHWLAQQHPKIESRNSDLHSVKVVGASIKKFEPTYDFSEEEFEVTTEQMRIVNDRKKKES